MCTDAVRLNPLTKCARNAEIEAVIKDWLRTASTRTCSTGPGLTNVNSELGHAVRPSDDNMRANASASSRRRLYGDNGSDDSDD